MLEHTTAEKGEVLDHRQVLQKHFGFSSYRGCQETVIETVLDDRHAMLIMPTGGGKSLCYQIPSLCDWNDKPLADNDLTLVLSPLIALMKDQVDALQAKGIDSAYVNSSLTRDERLARYQDIANNQFRLLYVTPERFQKPDFLEVLSKRRVRLLAVDEAHCISEWGHDFRPDYTRLSEIREIIDNPTTIALTATATPDVQRDIVRQLGLEPSDISLFHEGIDRPNLKLEVQEVSGVEEKLEAIESSVELAKGGSSIVYFTLIKTLLEFSDRLRQNEVPHVIYHGELPRLQRRRLQEAFLSSKERLVLATNAFGMGIDKEDIRLVAHAEVPGSMESYYQEIGRAGRDGQPSRCELLYDQADLMTQMEFIGWRNPDADFYDRLYDRLVNDHEQIAAFGIDWLRDKLMFRGKFDHRLETAIAMLRRHSVISTERTDLTDVKVLGDVPEQLLDSERLESKLKNDQQKLMALVQFVRHEGDRQEYLREYFGAGVEL